MPSHPVFWSCRFCHTLFEVPPEMDDPEPGNRRGQGLDQLHANGPGGRYCSRPCRRVAERQTAARLDAVRQNRRLGRERFRSLTCPSPP